MAELAAASILERVVREHVPVGDLEDVAGPGGVAPHIEAQAAVQLPAVAKLQPILGEEAIQRLVATGLPLPGERPVLEQVLLGRFTRGAEDVGAEREVVTAESGLLPHEVGANPGRRDILADRWLLAVPGRVDARKRVHVGL